MEFAFWDESFRLPLRVFPRERILQTSVATLVEIGQASVALRSSVTIQPRYAPVFTIQLQLPRDWDVTSVLLAGKAVEWESVEHPQTDPGPSDVFQTIQFDLAKPFHSGKSLEITLTAERYPPDWLSEDGKFSDLPLPDVRLVGADDLEGTVLIQTPPDMEMLIHDLSSDMQPVAADRTERLESGFGNGGAVSLPGRRGCRWAASGPNETGQGGGRNLGIRATRSWQS